MWGTRGLTMDKTAKTGVEQNRQNNKPNTRRLTERPPEDGLTAGQSYPWKSQIEEAEPSI